MKLLMIALLGLMPTAVISRQVRLRAFSLERMAPTHQNSLEIKSNANMNEKGCESTFQTITPQLGSGGAATGNFNSAKLSFSLTGDDHCVFTVFSNNKQQPRNGGVEVEENMQEYRDDCYTGSTSFRSWSIKCDSPQA